MTVKSKGKVLSIVLNNEFIKICELSRSGKNVQVHKTVTVPTPERSYMDGLIRDRGALCKTIKVALDDNRIVTNNVIFSIASNKIATKEVIIPNVKASKIESIIKTNATEYFPVNIEEHIIQYTVLEHIEENGEEKIKVLVMAAPSDMVETFYSLASSIGLKIESIDYIGNSTSHAIRKQIDFVSSIVIQVENDATIVNIFNNNVLELQRTIPYGKSVLVNTLMDTYNIRYEPALKKLQNEQLLHDHFDGDPVTESMRYLVSNINRIVDYYVSRNANQLIEKAYVIGNATTISGFNELMTNELHMPLESITHLNGVILDKKTYVDETTLTSYISNIGALISPVNFIPQKRMDADKSKDSGRLVKLIFTGAVVISILLILIPLSHLISVSSNLASVKKSNDRAKEVETIVDEYYQAKGMYEDAEQFRQLTVSNDDNLQEFIEQLEEKIPSDLSFKTISVSNGAVNMSGTIGSKMTLAAYVQQLQAMKGVSSVVIGSEAETKDSAGMVTVTFSMTCNLTGQN